MPGSTPHPSDYRAIGMRNIVQALQSIAQRQSTIIRDDSQTSTDLDTGKSTPGPVVMALGHIPSGMPTASPLWESAARPLYGHALYNRSTGKVVAHYGNQPDGSHGMWTFDGNQTARVKTGEIVISGTTYYGTGIYNSSGTLVAFLGGDADGTGVSVFDASGNLRAQLGELPSGDYGLLVENSDGSNMEVLPVVGNETDTAITVTSSSYGQTGPSVTVTIGKSGKAKVEASAYIATQAANVTGTGGLFLDGSLYLDVINAGDTAGIITTNSSSTRIISGLSAGSHTFDLRYKSSASAGVQFAARSLVVTPL